MDNVIVKEGRKLKNGSALPGKKLGEDSGEVKVQVLKVLGGENELAREALRR